MRQVWASKFVVSMLLPLLMETANAQTVNLGEKWNLEGTWKLSSGYFIKAQDGRCVVKIPTGSSGAIDQPAAIIKIGSVYSVGYNTPAEMRVSGDRVVILHKMQSGTVVGVGTISREVDKLRKKIVTRISGTETCNNQATLPFTFIKEEEIASLKDVYSFRYVRRNYTLAEGVGIHGTYSVEVNARVVGSKLKTFLSISSAAGRIGSLSGDGYVQIIHNGQPQQRIALTSKLKDQYLPYPGSDSFVLEAEKPLPLPANGRVELEVFVSLVLKTDSGFAPLEVSPSPERFSLNDKSELAGRWDSNWGPVVFNSDLSGFWIQESRIGESGSRIGEIKNGTFDSRTREFVFHYYQEWNDMHGTVKLILSQDANNLSGTWTQQRVSNPVGSGGSGGWTMTRNPSQ